jgi:hypothetical protein
VRLERRQHSHNRSCGVEYEVVRFIGVGLLVCILGGILLAALNRVAGAEWVKDVSLVLAGGLGSLLANTRGNSSQPVTVENPPTDPVPTVTAPAPEPRQENPSEPAG